MACELTSSYDENLMDNIFFQTLHKEFSEIFLKAIAEGCVICVPRSGSLPRYPLILEDFLTHILVPSEELPESHFRNLCGAEIKICNRIITVDHEVGRQSSIHILFQETFYTKDGLKYEVLCVEQSFDGGTDLPQSNSSVTVLKNLRDCLDLLWTECGNHETIASIDKEIDDFLKRNSSVSTSNLQDLVSSLYVKCVQILLKSANIKKKYKVQSHAINNLKIAVEAYIQHSIYKELMRDISSCTASDDAHLNKIIRNFSDLHFKDFNIKTEFYAGIPRARSELSRINGYSTMLGKIGCIRRTITALSQQLNDKTVLNTDDLLQLLAFLIIKTNLPNWNAQLKFLKSFQFSNYSTFDENNFFITTLEAAITFVQSEIFTCLNSEEGQMKVKYEEGVKNSESLKQISDKASLKEKTIHQFFHQTALGNLEKVKEVLEMHENDLSDYSSLNLCHPLCTCEKCSSVICKSIHDTSPTVKTCDDQGLTALHIAAMYGVPNVVEYLLANGADPNASDYDGRTPVHYAALRGHQNALLLLIHNDANINVLDNASNTPLHLCANNGHESCVKALIYFSEYLGIKLLVNQKNIKGDTPLHNAAKWGYLSIVNVLLEYGADPTILNKRKFSPIDYAHNVKVSQLLKQNCQRITNYIKIKPQNPVLDLCDQTNEKFNNQTFKGVQANSVDVMKKVEKVLRAVENGDVNLVCFYLGIDASEFVKTQTVVVNHQGENNHEGEKCHPLCTCAKCGRSESEGSHTQNGLKPAKKKGLNINICNSEGYTPLHVASKHGHLDLVKGFIQNGALLNAQTSKLLTPLMLACQGQNLKVVKELLDFGCKIDLQDDKLNTALHYACHTGNVKLVEILLKYEPNINLKNNENKTGIHIAQEKLSLGIIQILKGGKSFTFDDI